MKLFVWRWLAISSMLAAGLAAALAAQAETRPQYGGTLHISMRAAPLSLDPADASQTDSFAQSSVTLLMFDTLVTLDENGAVQPALAVSWQGSANKQHWQFRLRRGVKFHDGTTLTPEVAAASLRAVNPSWKVSADADSVAIEREGGDVDLLAELALSRNAIAKRNSGSPPDGTGPFYVADWQPGKKLTLSAEENYWSGRPFLDGIEIEMGRTYRDQMTALEMGRADLVEIAPEQVHRTSLDARRPESSSPVELVALNFARDAQSAEEMLSREALALSLDRGSMRSVLLQGAGQPAASILPNWMSGYGFVFSTDADLPRARSTRAQVRTIPAWTLGYDSGDPVARLLAERIALNARDAGLSVQPTPASTADIRLMTIPLLSTDPWIVLADVAAQTGLPAPKNGDESAEDLYAAEQTLLSTRRIIPLFHLPVSYAATAALKSWTVRSDGRWDLGDAWLGSGKP